MLSSWVLSHAGAGISSSDAAQSPHVAPAMRAITGVLAALLSNPSPTDGTGMVLTDVCQLVAVLAFSADNRAAWLARGLTAAVDGGVARVVCEVALCGRHHASQEVAKYPAALAAVLAEAPRWRDMEGVREAAWAGVDTPAMGNREGSALGGRLKQAAQVVEDASTAPADRLGAVRELEGLLEWASVAQRAAAGRLAWSEDAAKGLQAAGAALRRCSAAGEIEGGAADGEPGGDADEGRRERNREREARRRAAAAVRIAKEALGAPGSGGSGRGGAKSD